MLVLAALGVVLAPVAFVLLRIVFYYVRLQVARRYDARAGLGFLRFCGPVARPLTID